MHRTVHGFVAVVIVQKPRFQTERREYKMPHTTSSLGPSYVIVRRSSLTVMLRYRNGKHFVIVCRSWRAPQARTKRSSFLETDLPLSERGGESRPRRTV